jgi:hypothetical protein
MEERVEERSEERNEGERKGIIKPGADGKPPHPLLSPRCPSRSPPAQLNNNNIVIGAHALPRTSAHMRPNSLPPTLNLL